MCDCFWRWRSSGDPRRHAMKLRVALRLEVPHHFIKGFAGTRAGSVEHPRAFGATKTPKAFSSIHTSRRGIRVLGSVCDTSHSPRENFLGEETGRGDMNSTLSVQLYCQETEYRNQWLHVAPGYS
jgi:hypothetical protein